MEKGDVQEERIPRYRMFRFSRIRSCRLRWWKYRLGGGCDKLGKDGALTSLEVGELPHIDALAIYLDIENGTFEKHGLQVEAVPAPGGAVLLSAVLEGSVDVTYSNALTLMPALERGSTLQLSPAPHCPKLRPAIEGTWITPFPSPHFHLGSCRRLRH